MKNTILAISAVLFLTSCAVKKPVTTEHPAVDTAAPVHSNASFYDNIFRKSAFDNVKISSKIDVQNGSFVPTLNGTMYIENGQKIWLNLSALFINAARGIATPAGIKGYEIYGKNYIDSDFSYLNILLNVNFINYNSLQNLLVGKTFVPVNERDYVLTQNASGYHLESEKAQKFTTDGKTSAYKIALDYTQNFDLTKVVLQDTATPDNLEINYTNWENAGTSRFPKNVKIIIKGQKSSQILIENTKFDFAKMETPYSVPSNYTKKTIK